MVKLSDYNKVLLETVMPHVKDVIFYPDSWASKFKVHGQKYQGDSDMKVRIATHGNFSFGVGYELGPRPETGKRRFDEYLVTMFKVVAAFRVSFEMLTFTKGPKYQTGFQSELKSFLAGIKHIFSFLYFGDGTGKMANVTAVGGQSVTVDNTWWTKEGMRCDIVNSTGVVVANNVLIDRVYHDTDTVVFEGDVSAVDTTCSLYLVDVYHPTKQLVMNGLMRHVSATNGAFSSYQGQNRTTSSEFFRGHVQVGSNPGTPEQVTTERIFWMLDYFSKLGEQFPEEGFTTPGVFLSMVKYNEAQNTPTMKFDDKIGSPVAMTLVHQGSKSQITIKRECKKNSLVLFDPSVFSVYKGPEGFFAPMEEGCLRPDTTTQGYVADWYSFNQTFSEGSRTHGVMEDALEAVPY